jgi:sporulation protein YlmC with PRC-barrel domain
LFRIRATRRTSIYPEEDKVLQKANLTAVVAALLIAASPLAYAQTAATPHASTTATTAAGADVGSAIRADQFRASKMIGSTVYDVHNRNIGSVKDLVIDKDGRVAAAIIDVGSFLGMGGKDVAVGLSAIKTDNDRLTLDMTKEQLQQAQAYKLENPNAGAGSSTAPAAGGHLGTGAGSTSPRQ